MLPFSNIIMSIFVFHLFLAYLTFMAAVIAVDDLAPARAMRRTTYEEQRLAERAASLPHLASSAAPQAYSASRTRGHSPKGSIESISAAIEVDGSA